MIVLKELRKPVIVFFNMRFIIIMVPKLFYKNHVAARLRYKYNSSDLIKYERVDFKNNCLVCKVSNVLAELKIKFS